MDIGVVPIGIVLQSMRVYNTSHQIAFPNGIYVQRRWIVEDASMVIQMHPTTIKAPKNGVIS